MSLVKWVDGYYDTPEDVPDRTIGPHIEIVPTPVFPLSALTKLVEGLRDRPKKERLESVEWDTAYLAALDDIKAQLEAHRKEGV